MDKDGTMTVRSPRLGRGFYDGYVTVAEESMYIAIDALRIRVAEWDAWVGDNPADEASRAHVAIAAQALAELMRAMADHEREGGVRELVRQVEDFLAKTEARAYLDALRDELQGERDELGRQLHQMQQMGHSHSSSAAQVERRIADIADDLVLLDGLVALHEAYHHRQTERRGERARRHTPQQQHEEQAVAQQVPAPGAERDGWDF